VKRRGGLLLLSAWLLTAPVLAHDLISADAAQRYVAQARAELTTISSRAPALQRAEANLALGRMLDEIRDLLNRDLASHGKVQGLPSNYLMAELQSTGVPLNFTQGRFLAHVAYYREALRLAPDGPHAAEASLRWMRGAFYDSFEDNPLVVRGQTPEQLREQLGLGERFVQRYPAHAELEEVQFILLVNMVRAANALPGARERAAVAARAREAGMGFVGRYPDSMRAAAVPVLLEGLPADLP
jgi:hypothetical protein